MTRDEALTLWNQQNRATRSGRYPTADEYIYICDRHSYYERGTPCPQCGGPRWTPGGPTFTEGKQLTNLIVSSDDERLKIGRKSVLLQVLAGANEELYRDSLKAALLRLERGRDVEGICQVIQRANMGDPMDAALAVTKFIGG